MARTATRKKTPAIQPNGQYQVNVLRVATISGVKLKPRNKHILKGKCVAELGDAIQVIKRVK